MTEWELQEPPLGTLVVWNIPGGGSACSARRGPFCWTLGPASAQAPWELVEHMLKSASWYRVFRPGDEGDDVPSGSPS